MIGTDPTYFKGVYYLESQNPSMNLIAIVPEIVAPNYFSWGDTSNGRTVRFSKIKINGEEMKANLGLNVEGKDLPERIEILAINGNLYKLVKLTIDIFNKELKERVAGGEGLNFNSEEELQSYYLQTDFQTAR